MLFCEKINEFVKNFCGQWLQLRDLNFVNPNPIQFPKFTPDVRASMIQETEEFFKFLIKTSLLSGLILACLGNFCTKDII